MKLNNADLNIFPVYIWYLFSKNLVSITFVYGGKIIQ